MKTGDLDAEISVSDSFLDISVLGNGIEVVIKGQDLISWPLLQRR